MKKGTGESMPKGSVPEDIAAFAKVKVKAACDEVLRNIEAVPEDDPDREYKQFRLQATALHAHRDTQDR